MKTFAILIGMFFIFLFSCHPGYKRLTRGNWEKRHTILVKYPDLPKPILDTLTKYYEAKLTKDTSDNVSYLISFDPEKQFKEMHYYDMTSPKFRLPFGFFFKLGRKKYFIYRADLRMPLVYYDGSLYFSAGKYFDSSIQNQLRNQYERWPYDKLYIFKYKLK